MLDRPPPSTIDVGVDEVDDHGEAARQPVGVAGERRAGARLAGGGARRDAGGVARVGAVAVLREARGRRSASPGSCGGRTSRMGRGFRRRVGQGSGVWPHSPAMRWRPSQHAPVDDDAAAAAGAEDDAEHATMAGAGAVGGLREGEAVGVVLDPHLAAQRLRRGRGRRGGRSARWNWRSSPGRWRG